jgi:hypothetical protein
MTTIYYCGQFRSFVPKCVDWRTLLCSKSQCLTFPSLPQCNAHVQPNSDCKIILSQFFIQTRKVTEVDTVRQ